MSDFIYCEGCGEIRPLLSDDLEGNSADGKFTGATDLICGHCKLVIATTYDRRVTERPDLEKVRGILK